VTLFVGTSGWQYRHWRGLFYPDDLPANRWLEVYAQHFRTVEINNTFYRLPEKATFEAWARRTPADFVFAPKLSRYLSHVRRLREPAEPAALFLERARPLGGKCGPLLLQLPPTMRAEPARLADTLSRFPRPIRVAVEFRDASWYSDAVHEVLVEHGAALCLADRQAHAMSPVWRTADWTYLRFHQGTGSPDPCYRRSTLQQWAERLAAAWPSSADRYVYFNNDGAGCALRDAVRFAAASREVGLRPTRVPDESQTPVGDG